MTTPRPPTPKINKQFLRKPPTLTGRYYSDAEVQGMRGWLADDGSITFSVRAKINGKPVSCPLGTFHPTIFTLDMARAKARKQKVEWEQHGWHGRTHEPMPTLEEFIKKYRALRLSGDPLVQGRAKGLPKEWDEQIKKFKTICKELLPLPLSAITREMILQCKAEHLAREGTDPLEDRKLRHMMATVAKMLKLAVVKKWMDYAETIKLVPAAYADRTRFLLPGELQRIPAAWDQLPDEGGLFCRFIFATGCRPGMVHELEWADIDPTIRTLTDHGTTIEVGVWRVPPDKMKAGFPALVLLVGEALAIYRKFKADLETNPRKGETTVFPQRILKMWENNGGRWQRQVDGWSGTHDWYRHDLRRTLATYLKYLRLTQMEVSLAL
ncbi:MAG TPA: hypothetical protein VKB34_06240, partial [Povalibacter sp.]|nr:hypothetical protein [Povalibacter sp.]